MPQDAQDLPTFMHSINQSVTKYLLESTNDQAIYLDVSLDVYLAY